ncbi:hypothetical protein BU16DRAFT_545230 [Lophium mytilinum]|uniref:Uncharacterized protein n=1 Tax=Lophium mytilinum TaxID=390894 RepID=A0A6A6Q927_9PEZI|nr:hypothetical protein BU16DRAFT_545230 [Lophium mytilinum]
MANMPCGYPFSRRKSPTTPIPPPRPKQARTLGREMAIPTWPGYITLFGGLDSLSMSAPHGKMSPSSSTDDEVQPTMYKAEMLRMLYEANGRDATAANILDFAQVFQQRFASLKPKIVNDCMDLVLADPSYRPISPTSGPRRPTSSQSLADKQRPSPSLHPTTVSSPFSTRQTLLTIEWNPISTSTSAEPDTSGSERCQSSSQSSVISIKELFPYWQCALPGGSSLDKFVGAIDDTADEVANGEGDDKGDDAEDEQEDEEECAVDGEDDTETISYAALMSLVNSLEAELEDKVADKQEKLQQHRKVINKQIVDKKALKEKVTQLQTQVTTLESVVRDQKQVEQHATSLEKRLLEAEDKADENERKIYTAAETIKQQDTTEKDLRCELETANGDFKAQAKDLEEESKKVQLGLKLIGEQAREIKSLKEKLLNSEQETEEARDLYYQRNTQLQQKAQTEKVLRNHLAKNMREVACFNTQQAEDFKKTLERNASLEKSYEDLLRKVAVGLNNEELMHHFIIVETNHNSTRESHEVLRKDRDAFAKELREINYINSPYEDNLNSTKGLLEQFKKDLHECRTENRELQRTVDTLKEEKAYGHDQVERERERAAALEKLLDKEECRRIELMYADVCFMVDKYSGLPERVQQQLLDLYDVIDKDKETIQMLRQREETALSHARSLTYDMDLKNQKIEELGKGVSDMKASLADSESRGDAARDEVLALEMKEATYEKLANHHAGVAEKRKQQLDAMRGRHESLVEIIQRAMRYEAESGFYMVRNGQHTQLIVKLASELFGLHLRVKDYEKADTTTSKRIEAAESERDQAKKGEEKAWLQANTCAEFASHHRDLLENERARFNDELEALQVQLDKKKAKELQNRRREHEEDLEENKEFLDVLEQQARREDERKMDGRYNVFNKCADFTSTAFLAPHAAEARVDMMKDWCDERVDPQVKPTFDTTAEGIMEEARTKPKEDFARDIRRKKQEDRWAMDEASRKRVERAERAGTWGPYYGNEIQE